MTEQSSKATLYRKIAAVAGDIERVGKDGYNPQLKYKYATPATIMEAVKPLLAMYQLAIVPMMNAVIKEPTGAKTQSGADKVLTRVEMSYVILDGETGESLSCPWVGEGEDWSDKGIAKAQTIALRTFLIQLFQIPSGDEEIDPDAAQKPAARGAAYEPAQTTRQAPIAAQKPVQPATAPKKEKTAADYPRDVLITNLKAKWREEGALGGIIPAAALAHDLDNEAETPHELIWQLGKNAAARVKELKAAQELQPL